MSACETAVAEETGGWWPRMCPASFVFLYAMPFPGVIRPRMSTAEGEGLPLAEPPV